MEISELKKMADIVEAFANINNDINTVYEKMENSLKKEQKLQLWTKHEKGKRASKRDYYDFDDFLDGYWYIKNCYGEMNGKVYGFSFLIYINSDDTDYKEKFVKDLELNSSAPMVCIYGVYNPIDLKNIEFTFYDEDDTQQWYMEVMGITKGWSDFYEHTFEFNKEVNIQLDYKEDDDSISEGYEKWFKEANIKIIPITEINSSEKIEEVINELINMKI
jgi:hypothetical protein